MMKNEKMRDYGGDLFSGRAPKINERVSCRSLMGTGR